ncbi:hypothetical protein EFL99_03615 [Lactococcus lactis]|nr:hypothetical protein [Lactococcus lactis]
MQIIIIIVFIVLIGFAFYKRSQNMAYLNENKIYIKRSRDFYRLENVFSQKVDPSSIFSDHLNKYKEHLNHFEISVTYKNGEIIFRHQQAVLTLQILGKKEEFFRSKVRVTNYEQGSRSGVHSLMQMNVILSVIERCMLEIDKETLVQRQATTWKKQAFTKGKTEQINREIEEQNARDTAPKYPLLNDWAGAL